MSKELPYFKFFSDQWLGKKITLESYELQGIFINVCAIYWANDCDIKIATLQKRYGEAIDSLIADDYIKNKNGIAKISFLDSQWQERHKIHKENSNNGKAGAKARWDKYREANGEANGEAIENDIAIRKDKIKKDKIRENIIPEFSEFLNYALDKKPKVSQIDLKLKYDSWLTNDWKNGNDKKITNWKAALLNTLPYIKDGLNSDLSDIDREEFMRNAGKM
jgi:hypothetical protein